MYELARGPLASAAFVVFVAGLVFQAVRFHRLTDKKKQLFLPGQQPAKPKKKGKKKKKSPGLWPRIAGRLQAMGTWLRRSLLGTHPVMGVVTVVFHVLLFAVPLFLLAHNQLLVESWGLGLPSLSEPVSDFLTFVFLLCVVFFLVRRIFFRRVRAITTVYDYFVLLVTAAPFVTGFAAYHQWGDYQAMLTAHILLGELMLVLIPFTRLGHALFFFLYRFKLDGEYSFGQGSRTW